MIAGLKMGFCHKLSMHSDAITIEFFRQVMLGDIYDVHRIAGNPSVADAEEY
jgi:hypothetical protein